MRALAEGLKSTGLSCYAPRSRRRRVNTLENQLPRVGIDPQRASMGRGRRRRVPPLGEPNTVVRVLTVAAPGGIVAAWVGVDSLRDFF
jgi:hypothetical protein